MLDAVGGTIRLEEKASDRRREWFAFPGERLDGCRTPYSMVPFLCYKARCEQCVYGQQAFTVRAAGLDTSCLKYACAGLTDAQMASCTITKHT